MWRVNQTLFLFDLDGTLLDSAPNLARFAADLLQRHGRVPPPESALRAVAGRGAAAMLAVADAAHLSGQFLAEYREESAFFADVPDVLAHIPHWGIVSNKPRHLIEQVLPRLPVPPRVCVAGDDLPQRKPQPEPLWHACRLAGFSPQEALYIGDDLPDEEAARAAGIPFIYAAYGYGQARSAWVLSRLRDLKHYWTI